MDAMVRSSLSDRVPQEMNISMSEWVFWSIEMCC